MHKFNRVLILFVTAILIFTALPAVKASAYPSVIRYGGSDRYETASIASANSFTQSDYVVLASGENFPDALCAAPLSVKYNAPILLTMKNSLSSTTSAEIKRLGAKTALLIGGTGVISQNVETQLKGMGVDFIRIAGSDRYETSLKVAQIIGTGGGIVLASGENFPDALSIAPIAAAKQMPILLTTRYSLPANISNYIKDTNPGRIYVVGGTGVISSSQVSNLSGVSRLSGTDRYGTNEAVINNFSGELNFNSVYLATGQNFPDALGGSSEAAKELSPVILVGGSSSTAQDIVGLRFDSISLIKVLGQSDVIPDSLVASIINPHKYVLGYATYYYPGDSSSYNSLKSYSGYINGVATETLQTDGNGNISENVPSSVVNYANSNGIDTLVMVTNYFDGDIAKQLLESPSNRGRLIGSILSCIKANSYKGVNIDIEGIYSYDRPYFTTFMSELYNALHPNGYTVTAAVPAKTGDYPNVAWSGAYDYAQIGKYTDEVMLMTYDEHWSGGDPGPIASIGWVQDVVNYAVSVIPRYKILLGIAAYGYDWPNNGSSAKAYSIPQIMNMVSSTGSSISWDSVSESPYFNYTDSSGIGHTVWFENGTSVGYKLDIVNRNNLHGIAIWRLGLEDGNFWTTIGQKFSTR